MVSYYRMSVCFPHRLRNLSRLRGLPWHNMILIRLSPFALLVSMLSLVACDRLPETYPPPEQRHPVAGSNPDAMMVEMGDPDANLHIVKDVYGASNPSWRWTAQNPTVQLLVLNTENLKFHADFAIWDDGFKVTGPLEITYLVNGRLLDKVRYTTPGEKKFEKPVPADWVAADSDTTLGMSVDKLYVAPRDGVKFGVILVRMGFKQ